MQTRKLRNLEVSSIGMGCMGFSHGYGQIPTEAESIRLMQKAYNEYGCTLFDTAEVYAAFENEILKLFIKSVISSIFFFFVLVLILFLYFLSLSFD